MINFPSPLELAELVEPRIHLAKLAFDKLVEGIRTEQQCLGNRPFLTILWLKLLDQVLSRRPPYRVSSSPVTPVLTASVGNVPYPSRP
jgi:hypothetical protein